MTKSGKESEEGRVITLNNRLYLSLKVRLSSLVVSLFRCFVVSIFRCFDVSYVSECCSAVPAGCAMEGLLELLNNFFFFLLLLLLPAHLSLPLYLLNLLFSSFLLT
eukprot:scaffold681_cov173-Ochromonas_danica.AAC.27